jgi:ribosomal protein S18 acetylase RimI-like enzyme
MSKVALRLVSLAGDDALAARVAPLAAELIRDTGPVSYDFQFGAGDLLARVVEMSWPEPETLYAAANATVAMDGEALIGMELGFAGEKFYSGRAKLAALAPAMISKNRATFDELIALATRAEEAGYLNAYVPDDAYYIFALTTVSFHRRRGAGGALLRDAIARARAAGYREVQLDVLADNPAVAFYIAHGFEVRSEVRVPRLCRDHALPSELRMALTL